MFLFPQSLEGQALATVKLRASLWRSIASMIYIIHYIMDPLRVYQGPELDSRSIIERGRGRALTPVTAAPTCRRSWGRHSSRYVHIAC